MKDTKANHADRLRASEYLAKEKGMFKETPSFVAMFQVPEVKQMAQAVDMSIRPQIEDTVEDAQLPSNQQEVEIQEVTENM